MDELPEALPSASLGRYRGAPAERNEATKTHDGFNRNKQKQTKAKHEKTKVQTKTTRTSENKKRWRRWRWRPAASGAPSADVCL